MKIRLTGADALIVTDVQRDFLPGGALAIPGGEKVIAPLNDYIRRFAAAGNPVFLTRDWHPDNHLSFRGHGGVWPTHCVADTPGGAFSPELQPPLDNKYIISKGTAREFDAYSGFQGTMLLSLLQERGIRRVMVGGLATDYCIKNTVLGALNCGFTVFVLQDACQGVDVNPGDCDRAWEAMLLAGAIAITKEDFA